ncbi:tudor and KH domain-containing protein homolog isoform X2 [Venturia canescens]|uniref:tudor and KH domain-containing protein homolog isoform X2 n=1 Tax=Venturia canescens TaxID=32260 RepID=UPI001C9CC7C3|nr:tudor and KH domain-containing protein homolog isoform X2 [Venturia canescens]
MRWTPRQLMLPVIIGIALTGAGLGIIYLLVEKENEREKIDRETRGLSSRNQMRLEMQVPREFVPAVIGRGGTVIKSIENTTGTKIRFDDDNPDVAERICFIKGTAEGLRMAEAMIQNILASQPLIETYETYVPQRVCPKIIGRAGESIREIQVSTKAKIIIEKSWSSDPNSKRRVIIKGTAEQIASALNQIEDKVHEYNETLEKLVAGESSRSQRGKVSPRIPAINPPNDTPLLTQPANDETLNEGTMDVYVSAIENPSQFWVQVAGSGTLCLDELVAEMTAYYEDVENQEIHALKNVTVGQTVAAKFLFDGKWYRAEVISSLEDDECEVYFLDYGDHEIVSIKHVFELRTDFLSLRLQAIECSLANVKPHEGEWSAESIERFSDLTWVAQWKVLIAKVRGYKERALGLGSSRREGSPIPCVDLYDKNDSKDINIGKQMVVENLAEAEEGAWSAASSTLSLSRRSNDSARSPTPVRSPPPPPTVKKSATALEPRKKMTNASAIEEIDLTTTPQKSSQPIEEIDLVTPVRKATEQLVENEKSAHLENGGGDAGHHRVHGNGDSLRENGNSIDHHASTKSNLFSDDCESDESHNSDDLQLA